MFEGDSLDVGQSAKTMRIGRAIDSSLEVGGNIDRSLYKNSFDDSSSGEVQKACGDSLNQGCWQSTFVLARTSRGIGQCSQM